MGYSASVIPSWNEFGLEFTGQASVPGFCAAAELAPLPGFETASAVVRNDDGIVAAASPVFRTAYRLETSLPSKLRPSIALIERLLPRAVTVPLLGLGSPAMDRSAVGFRPGTSTSERAQLFSKLLDALEAEAQRTGVPLIALKDFGATERCWADLVLRSRRYARMASLPIAVLDLPFSSVDDYLETLSSSERRSLRRKLRPSPSVRFTECSSVVGVADEIAELYAATRANGKATYSQFDAISPHYVHHILQGAKGGAKLLLGWVDNVLASFALILVSPNRVYAHQIGMRYPLARENNLYFLNWIKVIDFCLEHKIPQLDFGQTSYPLKLRLGCRLEPSWIFVRHRTPSINAALAYIAPKFGFDPMESREAQERSG